MKVPEPPRIDPAKVRAAERRMAQACRRADDLREVGEGPSPPAQIEAPPAPPLVPWPAPGASAPPAASPGTRPAR